MESGDSGWRGIGMVNEFDSRNATGRREGRQREKERPGGEA